MKLYATLEQQLKKENNFVTDSGDLKKWVVLNKAQNFDEELIELLLDNKDLKEKFFINVKGVLVFNQYIFMQFLEQKNYLNDSYTQYKNKVGLTIDGKYLKQRNEVALVWPFKDCILEGGQSREEDKREEIFFNEILAQDEITQLLEPKVLTNAKRIDKDGEKPFDQFNRNGQGVITDNLIIKGNNLLALHTLKKKFAGKVKLIYIDPPYNTGNDGFKYNDNFNHSTWLTFMKNRLEISYDFLTNDGSIIISCNDNEQAYLKILCDDIFGKENFLLGGVVNRASEIASDYIVSKHEYYLIFAKHYSEFKLKGGDKYTISRGTVGNENQTMPIIEFPSGLTCKNIKDGIYKSARTIPNSNENIEVIDDFIVENGILAKPTKLKARWRSSNDMRNFFNNNCKPTIAKINGIIEEIYFEGDRFMPYIKKRVTEKIPSMYLENKRGGQDLKLLGMEGSFGYPKYVGFIKYLITLCTSSNDIILDFFSGSATTGHAVLESNKDGKNRQFILIEQMNYIETVAVPRLKKVIENNGQGEFIYLELKKYNQAFIEQIEEAKDTDALLQIWKQMKDKSFLNYNVDIKKQDEHLEEFKALSFAEQKQHLCEILDKNQLYVNRSSLNDTDFACTEEEKKVTKDFYQIRK